MEDGKAERFTKDYCSSTTQREASFTFWCFLLVCHLRLQKRTLSFSLIPVFGIKQKWAQILDEPATEQGFGGFQPGLGLRGGICTYRHTGQQNAACLAGFRCLSYPRTDPEAKTRSLKGLVRGHAAESRGMPWASDAVVRSWEQAPESQTETTGEVRESGCWLLEGLPYSCRQLSSDLT